MTGANLSDRETAILQVLLDAHPEALTHAEIVARLTSWYEKHSSFKASVSSLQGTLRSKRVIFAKHRPTGKPYIRLRGRLFTPTVREWRVSPAFRPVEGVKPRRWSDGGLVGMLPHQEPSGETIIPHVQFPSRAYRPGPANSVTITVSLDTSAFRRGMRCLTARPHTDDMIQMLDDINRIEVIPRKLIMEAMPTNLLSTTRGRTLL